MVSSVHTIGFLLAAGVLLFLPFASDAQQGSPVHPAQAYRAKGEPVTAMPDGTIICEAEEFRPQTPGWKAITWGENYYAATFANTFLSRKACLSAPEQCDDAVASITATIPAAGKYLVLARYEATYRFETRFRIKVEQGGTVVFDQLYGARNNMKVWAFGQRLKTEVAWPWGAVENVVWEGYLGDGKNQYADLQPGPAKISLIAGRQPGDAAKRNVDLVMLTTDEAQVSNRVAKEGYLPLDGWLTQAGDVFIKVTNTGQANVTVKSTGWQEHSPYWVHLRNWKHGVATAAPGQTSDWVDVGGSMDALNDGQWSMNASGPCKITFGLRLANGQMQEIKTLETAGGTLALAGHADTRYSRLVRTQEEVLYDLMAYLEKIPVRGKAPSETFICGYTFTPGLSPKYNAAIQQFKAMYGLRETKLSEGYEDWRQKSPAELAQICQGLTPQQRENLRVISLGDEIGLPAPGGAAATTGFVEFLKAQGLTPKQVDPNAADWDAIKYNASPAMRATNPGIYYWSQRYLYAYGIQEMKKLTDVLRKHLPNAQIGANFSPHHGGSAHSYLGEVFKWVTCFREDGLTLPWAEDYAWQVPIGTQQMNGVNLDLFRAGNRGKPEREILYYVMPHMPGNTPNMWRRLFYNALGHGMTIVDLFEFRPVWAAYTENHVTGDEMYGMVLKTFRELGIYEDIVQSGGVRPAEVGLWFSETGDIWGDNEGSFGSAKRALYIAILHNQLPLDFVVEQDAQNGALDHYKVLYLTDNHVSQAASRKIAQWVRNGGRLFATAGAGMFDEYNRPNTVLRELMGVDQKELIAPKDAQVGFLKEDLPFKDAIETVTLGNAEITFPALGTVSKVAVARGATVIGTFKDGSPAVVTNMGANGGTVYCGFLPGLSYFKPAIPRKPLDRGSTDDAMAHYIPTAFDAQAGRLVGSVAAALPRPVTTAHHLVEASVIESKAGALVVLGNWSGQALPGFTVTVNIPVPTKTVELASGRKVTMQKLDGGRVSFTFDMDIAGDALILR